MKKVLCHTVCVGTDALSGEERGFHLDYYLTESECLGTSSIAALCYGAEIEKRYFGESACAESAISKGLFLSEREGADFVQFLSENTVTPVSLGEVLEDLFPAADRAMPMGA